MAGIIPISNTRISGLLIRQRLTQQYQSDQLDLFRLQEQLSTGFRISLPSDDAPAALRAIGLQQLIERKGQLETNILTGRDFLQATDSALADVAGVLAELRGDALGVVGTLNSQETRDVALNTVSETLNAMLSAANQKFRGRFLFSGSQTNVLPYISGDDFVKYNGDANAIRSYMDIGILFGTNAPGSEVFGGISESVSGSVDLNPELNSDTLLSALRGGRGLETAGSLSISDGNTTSIVDLSQAVTMGDIVRMIEENPPSGRELSVSLTGEGLSVTLLDPLSVGGNFTINDVGNGTIAQQLGIVENLGVPPGIAINGSDLDPALLLTTQLDRLLGTKTQALLTSVGTNNDIFISGVANGAALNGATIQLVDDELLEASSGLAAGQEVAEYDLNARPASAALTLTGAGNDLIITANSAGTAFNNVGINLVAGGDIGTAAPTVVYNSVNKTLTITVDDDGETTVQQVIDEIASEGNFTATHDSSVEGALIPGASVNGGAAGNTGNSGGAAKTLYVRVKAGGSTATNVVDAINTQGTFTAKLHVVDSTNASDSGSGVVALNSTAMTSGGSGETLDLSSGIRVVNGGATHDIDVSQAQSVADLLNVLNSSGAGLVAEINAGDNGINVRSRISGSDFQIGENGGQLATQIGIRTFTQQTSLSSLNYGVGVTTQSGFDLPTAAGADLTIDTIDGQSFSVDLSGSESVSDVVAAINAVTGPSVTATAVTSGNASVVQLVDNSGAGTDSFTVTQATGSLAAQYLGIVPNGDTEIVSGGNTLTGNNSNYTDLSITAKDGQQFGVDLSAALTVGDVIDAINAATTGNVTAQLATEGNGIELVDQTGGGGDLIVTQVEGSPAAELLGLVPAGESSQESSTTTLTGTDQHFLQTDSVFTTLFRLRDALQANDIEAVERAIAQIDDDIDRVTFARADVGARQQGLDVAQRNLEDEDVQLRSALSQEIDVDLVEAISQITARQISLEASLSAMANILQLSLLNFI